MNREWTGIDRLRLDKFYMVRGPRVLCWALARGWRRAGLGRGRRARPVRVVRTLSRAGIRFTSRPGGARSPRWEGPPVTSHRGSCEFKAARAPQRA